MVTVLPAFLLAWFVSAKFSQETAAYISNGAAVQTNSPVVKWSAFVWILYAAVASVAIALRTGASLCKPTRLLLSMTVTFLLLYIPALVVATFLGIDGFFGLLAYHGTAEEWTMTRIAVILCPVATLAFVTLVAAMNSSERGGDV